MYLINILVLCFLVKSFTVTMLPIHHHYKTGRSLSRFCIGRSRIGADHEGRAKRAGRPQLCRAGEVAHITAACDKPGVWNCGDWVESNPNPSTYLLPGLLRDRMQHSRQKMASCAN